MRLLRTCALVLVVAALAAVSAASPRETLVVNAGWLASHLSDADLVLLEIGPKSAYDAGHIPGARFVTYTDLAMVDDVTGNSLQMLPAGALRDKLAALGISDRSHVVVYCSKEWISPATRVVFTLDYAGLQNVSLLDGGVDAWTRDGHALTTDVPAPKAGTLAPLKTKPIVVDAAFVKARLNTPGFSIVDARNAAFYDGVQTGGRQDSPHKTGHIPGAHSVPFNSIVDTKLSLKPADELAALFTGAGVKPGDTIVGYCHIGQQATATLFAARTLGYTVLLYDGSFEDWSRHADYPVENPSVKK
jgi:thiosulfate/3-mercaptopyruvate sulfurtransferase